MKKVLAIVIALALCLGLSGCQKEAPSEPQDTSTSNNQAVESNDPKEIEIIESGWSVSDSGYVSYAVQLLNPNTNFAANFPIITITGKDSEGKILFSDENILMVLTPNSKSFYGYQAGNGTAPTSVDISVSVADRNWKKAEAIEGEIFTITNVSENVGSYSTNVTGEITMNTSVDNADSASIVVVLRNESGAIVGGFSTYVSNMTVGKTIPFDVPMYSNIPHTSFDVGAVF